MNRFGWMAALLALSAPWTMGCPGEPPKVECSTPADCPKPTSACVKATCDANKCGTSNLANETAIDKQTAGDCVKVVCDGKGKTKSIIDMSDVLDDGNPCTDDKCDDAGMQTNDPSPAGTDCSASGSGTVCDGNGNCITPSCGNAKAEGTEACDGADLAGKTCVTAGFAGGTLACKSDCTLDTAGCTSANPCGNGAIDGAEQCDGTNLNGKTCVTEGFTGGNLACKSDCTLDLVACTAGADCGNGAINGTEQCDGTNLNGKTCVTQGFASGDLACNANCTLNTSACVAANPCGNGAIDGTEKCDGTNLNGKTCVTEGFAGGNLACKADCTFDLAACTAGADCGNGTLNGAEQCDGSNLNNKTCVTEGFASGNLSCNANCTLNTTQCVAANPCGNGQIDGAEKCDLTNLNGKSCVTEGFASGTLACKSDCTFDTTQCVAASLCGNGAIDGAEKCDTTNLNGKSCSTEGFASGTLSCKSDCTFDTTQCVAANLCGNSQIDGAEKCDGTNLNGKTCQTEGFGAGTLACKSDCTFNTAQCGAATCGVSTDLGTVTVLGGLAKGGTDDSGKAFVTGQFAISQDYDGVIIELREGKGFFTSGLATGSYTLSGAELAFNTCSLCVLMVDSLDKTYMPVSGSVELSSVAGNLTGTLTNVVFRQVTLGQGGVTTPVANGCTSQIASMAFDEAIALPPAAWTCSDRYYDDGSDCDCGCGVADPDCADATVDSCDWCDNPNSCSTEGCPGTIDPNDNSKCGVPCGNGAIDAGEECDQTNLSGKSCQDLGYTGGALACDASCKFDKTGCTGTTTCGNGQIDGSEACDLTNLNGKTCVNLGFAGGGTLTCTASCTLDTSLCSSVPTTWVCDPTFYDDTQYCDCGCGAADPDCAGASLTDCNCGGDSCADVDCAQIDPADFSKCVAQPCGNGALDSGEPCDGTLFGTKTCLTEGFSGGQLKCTATCALDTSACTGTRCGNGALDSGEACDGTLFGTKTCQTEGFASGNLKCTTACALDTSGCVAAPACQAGEVAKSYVASGLPVAVPDNNPAGVLVPIAITDTGTVASLKVKFSATHTWLRDLDISLSSPAAVSIDLSSDNGPSGGDPDNYVDTVFDDGAATSITSGTAPFTGSFKPEQPLSTFANTALAGTWNLKVADDGMTDAGTVDKFELHFCVKPAVTPTCGNNQLDAGEVCDGALLNGHSCTEQGFAGGTLSCVNCQLVTTGCTMCGNNALDGSEPCDGTAFGGKTCVNINQGFTGGQLGCSSTCTLVTSGCTTGSLCGNNQLDAGEVCDGTLLNGHSCTEQGFAGGSISCVNCQLVTTACTYCGNNAINGSEPCDGTNLNNHTCQTEGFAGGNISCSNCALVTTGCTYCGNNVINGSEPCDGTNLNNHTCQTEGFAGGNISCNNCALVTTGCTLCGNNRIDGSEICDGTALNNQTCTSINQGFTGGQLACSATCTLVTTGCTTGAVCGNNTVEGNEPCDGTQMNGHTCVTEGFTAGSIACANCALNTSQCTGLKCGVAQNQGTVTPVTSYAKAGGTQPNRYIYGSFDLNTQATPDNVGFELYEGVGLFAGGFRTGTFPLTGSELQYQTCSLCVLMIDELGKAYMPTGGTVVLSSVSGRLTGSLTNVSFEEVTINSSTWLSTRVDGGCTSNIASMAFDAAINVCGDGQVTGQEVCDGTNLNGITCADFGYGSGTPTCKASCGSINVNTDGTIPGCSVASGESTDAQCLNGSDDNTNTWVDCEEAACRESTTNVCESGLVWNFSDGSTCTDSCNLLDDCQWGLPDLFSCSCSSDAGCDGIVDGYRCYTELASSTKFTHPACGAPCQYLGATPAERDAFCTYLMGATSTCNATTGACSTGTTLPACAPSQVVISQLFGGGASTGATATAFDYDFVELHNRSNTNPATLTGWSIQYASATGTTWSNIGTINATIPPGGFFLLRVGNASTTFTTALPAADLVGTGSGLAATNGKVALVNTATALAGANPTGTQIVDLVGYGTANGFEGAAATAMSNTTSAQRNGTGCNDTSNNLADFTVGASTVARNSLATAVLCGCQ